METYINVVPDMAEKSIEIMREQLKKGYLKLSILYTLLQGPLHGYEMIKRIKESTFNLLTPTAGSLYPALKELEMDGFIRGEWLRQRNRLIKVYTITDKGKETFKEVIKKHSELASAIRRWLLSQIAPIHQIGGEVSAAPALMEQAIKIIMLGDNAKIEDKIAFLRNFREKLKQISEVIDRLILNIDRRIKDLEGEIKKLQ